MPDYRLVEKHLRECSTDCACPPTNKSIMCSATEPSIKRLLQESNLLRGSNQVPMNGDSLSNIQAIKDNLRAVCVKKFAEEFSYPFNGARSAPPDIDPNGALHPSEDFLTANLTHKSDISSCIYQSALSRAPFNDATKDSIIRGIGEFVSRLFVLEQHCVDSARYEESFKELEIDENGSRPIHVQAIMCHGRIDVSGEASDAVTYFFVYYCGVGYYVNT